MSPDNIIRHPEEEGAFKEYTNLDRIRLNGPIDTITVGAALRRVGAGDYSILDFRRAWAEGLRASLNNSKVVDIKDLKARKDREATGDPELYDPEWKKNEAATNRMYENLIQLIQSGVEFKLHNIVNIPACESFSI